MAEDREQRGPAVAPGEPDAPAEGAEPSPAPDAVPSEELSEDQGGVADEERPHEPEEDERQLERDIEELTAKAEKADEYLELAKRTKADFENYRKRAAREAAGAQERGIAKLAKELLPAVDDLDRALAAAESAGNGNDDLASGVKLVHAGVIAALARVGIEPFSPRGEQFDPERHEAVAQQAMEGAEPGTIVDVYQRGYRFGDSVLRPAKVVVAG